jgi:hypothetical protein
MWRSGTLTRVATWVGSTSIEGLTPGVAEKLGAEGREVATIAGDDATNVPIAANVSAEGSGERSS